MLTYVFPGQGSQHKGMGDNLFDEFKDLTAQADDVLNYSIKKMCLEDPLSNLGQTQFTQPALYVVNALSYLKKIQDTGKKPDFLAGHSLGEYNALFAAGAFDFNTGLKLVRKRGELMSQVSGGSMAAIVGLNKEQIGEVLKQHRIDSIDIANHNTHDQIVISGLKEDIDRAGPIFTATSGVQLFFPLNVSGAFHSRYMGGVKAKFEEFLNSFDFHPLSIPVISNVSAQPYENQNLKATLAQQINSTVKWLDSVRYLLRQGEMIFEEVGPGTVLNKLIQKIKNTELLSSNRGY